MLNYLAHSLVPIWVRISISYAKGWLGSVLSLSQFSSHILNFTEVFIFILFWGQPKKVHKKENASEFMLEIATLAVDHPTARETLFQGGT